MASEAEELKKKGNDCMKELKFIEAMWHYTQAVKLSPSNHLLYSNRSLAFLKMQDFHHALQDANQAIKLAPQWAKGYFRKGEVEFHAEHYEQSVTSYTQAMIRDKEDGGIKEALSKARREMHKHRKKQSQMPIYGAGGGVLLGILIVVGDAMLTSRSSVQSSVLRVLIVAVFGALGYAVSISFRYILQSQRNALLEEPVDLLEAIGQGSSKENSNGPEESCTQDHSKESRYRKGSAADAKRRYKKGKS